MVDLMALAEAVERAAEGSRDLDAAIAVGLRIGARGVLPDDHEYLSPIRKDDGCTPGTYWFCCRSGRSLRTAPAFTTSIDAAMTLRPVGWSISFGEKPGRPEHLRNFAWLNDHNTPDGIAVRHVEASARTIALAITAVCLRAALAPVPAS